MMINRLMCLAVVLGVSLAHKPVAAEEPGVTATEVKIGLFGALSGPFTPFGVDPVNAAAAYYESINQKGGIHGRKIKIVIADDKCSPTEANAVVRKLVESDHVFLLNGGSCTGAAVSLQGFVEKEKIPFVMLLAAGDGAVYPPTHVIFGGLTGTQRTIGGAAARFAVEALKGKRIAITASDDDYGKANSETAAAVVKASGAEVVLLERIPASVTDVSSSVLSIRAANPDVILSGNYPPATVMLLQKAYEFGVTVPFVSAVQGVSAPAALAAALTDKQALANFYYSTPLIGLPNGPELKHWFDFFAAARPDRTNPPPHMPSAIVSAMVVVKALETAGPNLTRESFLAAMEHTNFDTGIAAGPEVFSADRHDGMRAQRFIKFDGSTLKLQDGTYFWKGER